MTAEHIKLYAYARVALTRQCNLRVTEDWIRAAYVCTAEAEVPTVLEYVGGYPRFGPPRVIVVSWIVDWYTITDRAWWHIDRLCREAARRFDGFAAGRTTFRLGEAP